MQWKIFQKLLLRNVEFPRKLFKITYFEGEYGKDT